MNPADGKRARALGETWAEAKAELLAGNIPAFEWPEVWRPEWMGTLDEKLRELPDGALQAVLEEAHAAAAERWAELLIDNLRREDSQDAELDDEARAISLVELVQPSLPPHLWAGHDGPRAFLQDRETGEEHTITSLSHAWSVIDEWKTAAVEQLFG